MNKEVECNVGICLRALNPERARGLDVVFKVTKSPRMFSFFITLPVVTYQSILEALCGRINR